MTIRKILIVFITTISLLSCEGMFDYSPYLIDFSEENRNANQQNIGKLANQTKDDTITIAFTGDTHRWFDETEKFVAKVNQKPFVDFVIHVGDIADFGLPKQYIWGNSYLLKLNIPYFVVVGNHDLVGNGLTAYNEMFGSLDFSFIYNKVKFVFLNTNSREFLFNGKVPNIQWLDNQLKPSIEFTKAVVIFHVPPMHGDFDTSLDESFHNTLMRYNNVLFTVHGHSHNFEIYKPYNDDITCVNVYSIEYNKFNVIKISNDQFEVTTLDF